MLGKQTIALDVVYTMIAVMLDVFNHGKALILESHLPQLYEPTYWQSFDAPIATTTADAVNREAVNHYRSVWSS